MVDRWKGVAVAALGMVVTGCGTEDAELVAQSGALVVDGDVAFVADRDNGEVLRIALTSGAITACPVGVEPARIAQIGDVLIVSLVGDDSVVALRMTADGCEDVARVDVGVEPWGIAVAKGGGEVYVAAQGSGHVAEIDVATWTVVRKFAVPGGPRWVTAHPSGAALYVGTVGAGAYVLDLRDQEPAAQPINPPAVERGDANTGEIFPTTPRVTGAVAIDPEGGRLGVPLLYVEHTSPVDGDDVPDDGTRPEGGGGYADGNPEGGLTRFNPAIATMDLDAVGMPKPASAQALLVAGRASATLAMGGASSSEVLDQLAGFGPADGGGGMGSTREMVADTGGCFDCDFGFGGFRTDPARGYLAEVRFGPEGRSLYASIEGADMVAILPAEPVQAGQPFAGSLDNDDPFFGDGATITVPTVFVRTAPGATGVAFRGTAEAWTYSFLERTLHRVDRDTVDAALQGVIVNGAPSSLATWAEPVQVYLGPSVLPPQVLEGRRLFYSASHPSMTTAGAGVSCATCHFDGRNDGLTWQFDLGPRQTSSLAGVVSETAPVTWTNDVDSVATEARLTSQGRMGGNAISEAQVSAIQAYVDSTPAARTASPDAESVARGRVVFQRADTACSTCHNGPALTDNRSYAMHGLTAVNTPTLRGVGATGPYLHDGAAASLRDLVDMADAIGMGSTRTLSEQDKVDLVAYLTSL